MSCKYNYSNMIYSLSSLSSY